jgi:hypothetical protein
MMTMKQATLAARQPHSITALLQRAAIAIQLVLLVALVAGRAAGAIGDARPSHGSAMTPVPAAFASH